MPNEPDCPARSFKTKDELQSLLLEGLESGEPKPISDEQWQDLRKRALANTVLKSG